MAKKIWYGKCFQDAYQMFNVFRKIYPDYPDDEVKKTFLKYSAGLSQSQDDLTYLQLFKMDIEGVTVHIYPESKELIEFLKKTKVSDIGGILSYVNNNGISTIVTANDSTAKQSKSLAICLHTLYEKEGYVLAYYISKEGLNIFVRYKQYQYHASSETLLKDDFHEKDVRDMIHFALNLLAYIICFPECLIDGVPKRAETGGRTLNISKDILESIDDVNTGRIVSPHFRRGYFKLLSSDFYTKKKGQIIFIHETMVKGIAKTLTDGGLKNGR